MARFPIAPLTKGLNTLLDAAAGDPQASPDLKDVRGHTGILTLRKGYRVLDIEPSWNPNGGGAKTITYLGFDGINDYAYNTAWTQTLGTKWTVRIDAYALSLSSVNQTDGTRLILTINAATYAPFTLSMVGSTAGGTAQLRAVIKDYAGTTATLTGTARTTTQWTTLLGNHAVGQIRVVRDGATISLYVGETLDATTTTFSPAAHEAATGLYVGSTAAPGGYAVLQMRHLAIINRALTEAETYWNLGYPTDAVMETDVLGCWPFAESSGTTVKDYSSYEKNLTISGATWSSAAGNFQSARGLGIKSWRRANGDIYHALACGRVSTNSSGAAPSGAIYSWPATQNFLPFYFGGVLANTDATAGLDGLNLYARVDFAQGKDMLIMSNGVDYCRKYQSAYKYLGGTAPPTAPVVVTSGGAGITATWLYAYSYYNPTEGTETGLSPTTSISITDDVGCSVTFFDTLDTQFTKVRIYRSQNGDPALYLVTEVAAGSGAYADTKTDADLRAGPLCAGSDVSGNRGRKRAYKAFGDYDATPEPTTPAVRITGVRDRAKKGPPTAPTLAESNTAQGALTLTQRYYVCYSYYDSTNDVETGLSAANSFLLTGANDTLTASALVLPPEGSRYDKMRIYTTKGNGVVWYLDQEIAAATSATITQADSGRTSGLETKSLPPRFTGMAVFANRLWGFHKTTLYWSTAGYFEDHPEANGFAPKSGVDITAICATEGGLFVHFKDGTIHLLPHPGDEPDLSYFVPLNLKQWSPIGAAVGHFTSQAVPGGVIWLAKDGFYFANPDVLENISSMLGPSFLNLNGARGAYACSMYDSSRRIYRCWLSRGNNRLNEECFVYYLDDRSWWLDNISADAAGILYDSKENPHYCFLRENGVLLELDETLDYDGDGSGTLSGTVTTPTIGTFADIAGRTAPTGGDGGYPIWLVKSDGTMVQRTKLDPKLDVRADVDGVEIFYPSYSGITSGTWTAYFHGIRGYIKTMLLHLGDLRHPKNIIACYFFNRVQSAGGLQVNLSADEGTFTALNDDVALTEAVSQITPAYGSGRVFQFEIYSDPPAASRPWGLKGMEVEAAMDKTDAGS